MLLGFLSCVQTQRKGLRVYSNEGVTQGDPLSMLMYEEGSLPLIHSQHHSDCTQVWYVDDASVCGHVNVLREWFSFLEKKRSSFWLFQAAIKDLFSSICFI